MDENLISGFEGGAAATGGMLTAFAGAMLLIILLILIPLIVLVVVGRYKMYKKAGKQGWEAIVPFYSDWVYVEISGLEWWWFFALVITNLGVFNGNANGNGFSINFGTLIGLFGSFICNYNISKKLHKDVGFAVLMTLFPFVMLPLIGFSKNYTWDNDVKVSKNGPFDDKKDTTVEEKKEEKKTDKDSKHCPHCGEKVEKDSKFCSKCGKEI